MLQNGRPLALVTGGSSGIGQAICERLARDGFDVVFQYGSNAKGAQDTAALIEESGGQHARFSFDFGSMTNASQFWEAAQRCVTEIANNAEQEQEAESVQFNALILNAGIDQRKEFSQFSPEDITRVFQINTIAPTLIMQNVRNQVAQGGSVVITSSTGAVTPIPTSIPYSMSKAAINMLVAGTSQVLAPHGIRVNAVAPGIVDTPLQSRERIAQFAHSGAVGHPEDIAGVVSFLVSSDSRWVNGQIITASGGK